jgi:hypothetical protein
LSSATHASPLWELAGPLPWSKRCGVCRRTYDADGWGSLPAVLTLPPSSVQPHLTVPAGWTVVIRRCTCGAVLAARSG